MQKIIKGFSSSTLALVLLFAFGVSMAVATFVENDFGTAAAWIMIYDAWWFELIMVGLALCFLANIFKYGLHKKGKWAILLFHLAFIVIVIGAGITRYASYNGIMRIREGFSSNTLISSTNYLTATISDGKIRKVVKSKKAFTTLKNNDFTLSTDFKGKPITISYKDYIADAEAAVVMDEEEGKPLLEVVVTEGNGRKTIYLSPGEVQKIGTDFKIGFNAEEEGIINILGQDSLFQMRPPQSLDFFVMATQQAGKIQKDSLQNISLRTLYRAGDFSFVPLNFYPKGKFEIVSASENPKENDKVKDDALLLNVDVDGKQEEVNLLYREGFLPISSEVKHDDLKVELSYGSEAIELPFKIQLNDFQLERYPGSSSPSSYASEVAVLDGSKTLMYRIFMNNVLDYKGFRFFQASYDTDEKGTVLSVNYDQIGTWVTYIGYFLMSLGMLFSLFGKSSRFQFINRKLRNLKAKQSALLLLFCALGQWSLAQDSTRVVITDEIIRGQEIEIGQANQFGQLLVQDLDGRIKPINTLASEFIRKISRKSKFEYPTDQGKIQYNVNQTFLAMHMAPNVWQRIPIIKADLKKTGDVLDKVQVGKNGLIAFSDLMDNKGNYLLAQVAEEANQKKPAERDEFDNEILKIDERFNILYNLFSGHYMKIFPLKDDDSKTWYSFTHDFKNFSEEDAVFTKNILMLYFSDLIKKDYNKANENLNYIKQYQKILAPDIIPPMKRLQAEIWYNELNMNFWLFIVLFTLGFAMLVLAIIRMFVQAKWVNVLWDLLVILTLLAFICFTGNIILRWYVSQHAPWSNGYEMLVFVAWTLLLSGLITFRKSDFSLPLATLFTGTLLLVSYLDWLSPEITNLMPVLKSYWLKIHVATIVSSYAPLALSCVLGFMALIFMVLKTNRTKAIYDEKIKEMSYISEMAMTIGLFLLSIGTFLGGVWANESWGRYWAWDPKETWALISIIVYAFVLHLRLIPKLNSYYVLNTASMFAFWSIIMTSFGVNYYLSGLHSYAAGDPMPIPSFVYYVAGTMIVLAIWAYGKVYKSKAN